MIWLAVALFLAPNGTVDHLIVFPRTFGTEKECREVLPVAPEGAKAICVQLDSI